MSRVLHWLSTVFQGVASSRKEQRAVKTMTMDLLEASAEGDRGLVKKLLETGADATKVYTDQVKKKSNKKTKKKIFNIFFCSSTLIFFRKSLLKWLWSLLLFVLLHSHCWTGINYGHWWRRRPTDITAWCCCCWHTGADPLVITTQHEVYSERQHPKHKLMIYFTHLPLCCEFQ